MTSEALQEKSRIFVLWG